MYCNEPLNLEKPAVRDHLGLSEWAAVHSSGNQEKLYTYIDGLCSGNLRDARFNRPAPFSEFYRPVTRRIVFKIISAGQEYINWMASTFNGRVLFLLRHPIPVSLSRKRFPKLETILDTDFRQFFNESQLALAARIIHGDNKFARGVLDWCLQNSVALRSRTDDWMVLTYEQLVLDPVPAVNQMAKRLELPKPDRIIKRLAVPSRSTELSDHGTQDILNTSRDDNQQQWLVEKWRKSITEDELALAVDILDAFDLSKVYRAADALPNNAYWIA
jgi:hypothetical protein